MRKLLVLAVVGWFTWAVRKRRVGADLGRARGLLARAREAVAGGEDPGNADDGPVIPLLEESDPQKVGSLAVGGAGPAHAAAETAELVEAERELLTVRGPGRRRRRKQTAGAAAKAIAAEQVSRRRNHLPTEEDVEEIENTPANRHPDPRPS